MRNPKKLLQRHLANVFRQDRSGASPGERISFGAFWSLAGTLAAQFSGMIAGIITARLLGKTIYGELGLLTSTLDALAVVAGLSLSVTLTKHLAETAHSNPVRAGNILRMTAVIAGVGSAAASIAVFIFSDILSERIFGAPHLSGVLKLSSPLIFFGAVYGLQTGALSGLEAFKNIAFINTVKAAWQFPLMLAGAYFFSLKGAVAALTISSAAACILSGIELKKETKKRGIHATGGTIISEPGILLDFSTPAFLSSLLYSPAIWLSGLILATSPGGYSGLGVFNAANQWRTFLIFLPDMMSRAVMPVFSSILASGNRAEARSLFFKFSLVNLAIAAPVALAIILLKGRIMGLYGPQFSGGEGVIVLVTLSALMMALASPAGNIIAASGRMWIGMTMNLGWAVTLVFSAHIFIGRGWGAAGLAAAYVTAYAVHGIWVLAYLLKMFRLPADSDS